MAWIKKIQDSQGAQHEIDAKRWDGHDFSEVIDLVHGVVDTYVIPTSHSNLAGYADVVNSNSSSVEISQTNLKALVGFNKNDKGNDKIDAYDTFKIGDIILVEALSNDNTNKGEKAFDRWISAYNKSTDMFTLSVLETQVATHHHTITTTSSKALTSVTPVPTTIAMATTGSDVTVVTGRSSVDLTSGWDFLTSVSYSDDDEISFTTASTSTSTNVGHAHTVNSHNHSVTIGNGNLVSSRVSAYTSLTSVNRTLHEHNTDATVAGSTTNESSPTIIVTGGSTTNIITSLTDSEQTTGKNTSGLATGNNSSGLSTSAQTSGDIIGDIVKTKSDGYHSHTLSSAETANVITSASVAAKVITNVTASNNTSVAESVVTGITYVSTKVAIGAAVESAPSAMFLNNVSVDGSGVLSFGSDNALTGVTVTYASTYIGSVTSHSTASQSAAAPTLTLSSVSQSVSYGKVAVSGTISESGSHTHGFSHTHSIPSHTHTIAAHTHTYNKSIQDSNSTIDVYTSLTSTSRTLHSHADNTTVAGSTNNDASPTKIIIGGSQTSVIESLVADKAFSTTSSRPTTDTQYYDIDIKYPGLTFKGRKFTTKSITEASATTVKPIVSIGSSSADFINSVNEKTSKNNGGE